MVDDDYAADLSAVAVVAVSAAAVAVEERDFVAEDARIIRCFAVARAVVEVVGFED